jgi:hypothetical protein
VTAAGAARAAYGSRRRPQDSVAALCSTWWCAFAGVVGDQRDLGTLLQLPRCDDVGLAARDLSKRLGFHGSSPIAGGLQKVLDELHSDALMRDA